MSPRSELRQYKKTAAERMKFFGCVSEAAKVPPVTEPGYILP